MAKVHAMHRPSELGEDVAGLANRIVVTMDLDGDGTRLVNVTLDEADHAGLIAEWETGTATTVLSAAIDAELALISDPDELSTAQRAFIGNVHAFPP